MTVETDAVYLAGRMGGLTYRRASEWRDKATHMLAAYGIRTLNPMRWLKGMDPYHELTMDGSSHSELEVLRENGGRLFMDDPDYAFKQDRADISRSRVLFANLSDPAGQPERVSLGTVCEMAYAYERGLTIVANVGTSWEESAYNHLFIWNMIDHRVTSLGAAVITIADIYRGEL